MKLVSHPLENFDKLFREWHVPLAYFAFRFTGDKEAAEDIVQDSFIKMWERKDQFDNIKVFKSYLYSTVRNASLTWLRSKKNAIAMRRGLGHLHASHEESLFGHVLHAEFMNELYAAMGKLPPQCKRIYEMLYIEGKTPKEVANELGLSVSTIKYHKAFGLSLLRKMMALLAIVFFQICITVSSTLFS